VIVRRISLVALVVVGLVAGAAGGASAATVSPSEWAPSFCTAVIKYQTTLSTKGDALSTSLDAVDDLATGRDQIASYLAEMSDAAKTAKTEVKEAGVPSSPNGTKIVALFTGGLDNVRDSTGPLSLLYVSKLLRTPYIINNLICIRLAGHTYTS